SDDEGTVRPVDRSCRNQIENLVREQKNTRCEKHVAQKSCFHQDRDITAMIVVEHPTVVLLEIIVDRRDRPETVDSEAEQRRIVEMAYRVVPDEGPFGKIDGRIAN